MADLYSYSRYQHQQYPSQMHHSHSHSSDSDDQDSHKQHDQSPPKPESKPQATFLTKLYALLERPENHHMIRWDPAGEHIIVERPEQLALHVLPSIYRQSRFASFSRQLNIYGFMRKVNLRNVDPAIDDPDASTWSHPNLNRHSPPEVVANFKRRVPPRLPKPRKQNSQDQQSVPPPRSAAGMAPVPLSVPGGTGKLTPVGRARGFSAPSPYVGTGNNWNGHYQRNAGIPPLTVPSNPPHISHNSMYSHSSHHLQPISPAEESPSYSHLPQYNDGYGYSNGPGGPDSGQWNSYNGNGSSNHNGSLSSLLNPSGGGHGPGGYNGRPSPTINTNYSSQFAAMDSASSLSPDSRPTTGYSISSVNSMQYPEDHRMHGDYDSRPNSSHHRPGSPGRPHSSSSRSPYPPPASLSIRRPRRHSQAVNPYPSPYENDSRPSTSPGPPNDLDGHPPSSHGHSPEQLANAGGLSRVRSMIQLPSVDPYSFANNNADFAYNAGMDAMGPSEGGGANWRGASAAGARPSTGASSISAASSSSQANTPPIQEGLGDTVINRFSPDYGLTIADHIPTSQPFTKNPMEM